MYATFDGSQPVRRIRLRGGPREIVSTTAGGAPRNGFAPQISHDGSVVSFCPPTPPTYRRRPSAHRALYGRDLSPGGSYIRLVDAWVANHTMSGNGLTYAFTTEAALLRRTRTGSPTSTRPTPSAGCSCSPTASRRRPATAATAGVSTCPSRAPTAWWRRS